nr:hypothetical protein [Tanacetum cinerariifolium]
MDFVTNSPRTSSGHDTILVIMNRLTKSAHFLPMRKDYKIERLARLYLNETVARHEVEEGQLIGPELVQETIKNILQIKDRLKVVRDRQKSYADKNRKSLEFSVGSALCKCSSTGRPLGAYDLEVVTSRALVYAGLMTSGDARS